MLEPMPIQTMRGIGMGAVNSEIIGASIATAKGTSQVSVRPSGETLVAFEELAGSGK